MKQFLVAIIIGEIIRPGNFEKWQQHVNAYCENEQLNYSVLESNLRLLFGLVNEYNQTKDPLLYQFLKLQATNCLLDEQAFDQIPIILPEETHQLGLSSSANHYFMVGGHLIGL